MMSTPEKDEKINTEPITQEEIDEVLEQEYQIREMNEGGEA